MFFSQCSDVKIRDATNKLSQSTITQDEFLRQVVYQSSDVCNGLLAFDSVAANDDEMIDGLAEPPSQETSREPSREPSPQPSSQPERDHSQLTLSQRTAISQCICKICLDKQKAILLQPCGHFAMCQECFDSLVARALVTPAPKSEKTKKKLKISCPICREPALVYLCKTVYNV